MDPTLNPAFVLFAALSPLLISLVKQSGFSPQVNAMLALACYIVVGILGVLMSGEALTAENAIPLIAIATVVGRAAYSIVWDNLMTGKEGELNSLDERLTEATSLVR